MERCLCFYQYVYDVPEQRLSRFRVSVDYLQESLEMKQKRPSANGNTVLEAGVSQKYKHFIPDNELQYTFPYMLCEWYHAVSIRLNIWVTFVLIHFPNQKEYSVARHRGDLFDGETKLNSLISFSQ